MTFMIVFLGVIVGACIGSFAGCAYYRIPRGISIVAPRSHCPACKHTLNWYENIPIISYLTQYGKARCCGARMSSAYLILEIDFAIIGGLIAYFLQS